MIRDEMESVQSDLAQTGRRPIPADAVKKSNQIRIVARHTGALVVRGGWAMPGYFAVDLRALTCLASRLLRRAAVLR